MISDKASREDQEAPESTSDKTQPLLGRPRRGRQPAPLPARYAGIHTSYAAELAKATMLHDDTRRAYASRVRQYPTIDDPVARTMPERTDTGSASEQPEHCVCAKRRREWDSNPRG